MEYERDRVLNDPLLVGATATDVLDDDHFRIQLLRRDQTTESEAVRRSIENSFANLATSTKPADIDGSLSWAVSQTDRSRQAKLAGADD